MTKTLSVGRRSLIVSTAPHTYEGRFGTITTRGGGLTMRSLFALRRFTAVLITR
jgi:hypothetical protein